MSDIERAPKVGDLYADNDPRAVGRVVEVIELLYRSAFMCGGQSCGHQVLDSVRVKVVQDRRRDCLRSSVGKETRINIQRLRPTSNGYRPIKSLDEA